MTTINKRPAFIDSPFLYISPKGWALKPGAPPEVQAEFDAYMALLDPPGGAASGGR